ncbi:hypothetical protein AB0K86_27305 [Streptomyces clavifer]|uniref:hypothetical protein n=1 Tax=Streptomyces TaxID=1883 RepID=UPI0006FF4730|nr:MULTISPECIES: hypothetical protein [unclassified Streptomyces]KQX90863.1 hypothetical protein ASD26_25890 [Streptomyces sp. Root1319]KQZ12100.1 hypothetical protein ASD51_33850 [Streptomyces sp. Root55]MDX3065974.1 hypothetical protein [Streptomyces sp. ND04-05B]
MFARRNRRPPSPELAEAREHLDRGDVPGALRELRRASSVPLGEVAVVVGRAAAAAGFDDLRKAAAALAAHPDRVRPLYDYGYACVERGVSFLAIPALGEALRLSPGSSGLLRELVSAYEDEGRHRDAADALLAHEDGLADWPDRYLLVFNAVLAGDLELARRQRARLPAPAEDTWLGAHDRQNRVLDRAADTGPVSPLDHSDLRGWQYVMGGTVLGTLSPHGFDAGMAGRYAWVQDTHGRCLHGLLRLKAVLGAAGVRPGSVSLLPDRGSRILGLAAAEVLGLPAVPFEAGREDTVVIAYDLDDTARADGGPEALGELFHRAPGQVLHEHASCWTDPPAVAADSVTLLHQSVVPPWGETLGQGADGGMERGAADGRPEAEIAADITGADPVPDTGDDQTPADPLDALTDFASAVRGTWLRGDRARLRSSGPVASSRFL